MPPLPGLAKKKKERRIMISQYPEVYTSGYEYNGPAGPIEKV